MFSGGDGIIYGVTPIVQPGVRMEPDGTTHSVPASGGDLMWFRHVGREDGSFRWEGPKKVGTGWGELTQVFSGGDGIIYGVTPIVQPGVRMEPDGTTHSVPASGGDLMWFRHVGREDGSFRWEGPKKVGTGWGELTQVFSGGDGIIYGVTPIVQPGVQIEGTTRRASGGDLMWFRHVGREDGSFRWEGPKKVGTGWGELTQVFSGGDGIIYGVTPIVQPGVQIEGTTRRASGGDLMWFRHVGREDGSFRWEGPKKVGTGWGGSKEVFSGDDDLSLAEKAQAISRAWEELGGPRSSLLGLPIDDGLTALLTPLTKLDDEGGAFSNFRGGSLHISNVDNNVFVSDEIKKVKIILVGIECRIRQESVDEVFGSVGVIIPSSKTSATHHFPGEADKSLQMGDGARIVQLELEVYDGVIADIILPCVLVEHDSGNIDEYKKKAAEYIAVAAMAGLGAVGVPAEAAGADQGIIGDITLGLVNVLSGWLGADDDPYTPQALRIPGKDILAALLIKNGELLGVPAPFKEQTLTRGDDPRTLSYNIAPVIVTGIDQGGDRGEYAFYFKVEPRIERREL